MAIRVGLLGDCVGRSCYGFAKRESANAALHRPCLTKRQTSSHYVSSALTSAFLAARSPSKVFTRFNAPLEYACTVSRAELAFACMLSYTLLATRTTDTGTLATGERACKAVCSLACCFAQWVLGCATGEIGDALLELERVGLIGGGNLVDLIWRLSMGWTS